MASGRRYRAEAWVVGLDPTDTRRHRCRCPPTLSLSRTLTRRPGTLMMITPAEAANDQGDDAQGDMTSARWKRVETGGQQHGDGGDDPAADGGAEHGSAGGVTALVVVSSPPMSPSTAAQVGARASRSLSLTNSSSREGLTAGSFDCCQPVGGARGWRFPIVPISRMGVRMRRASSATAFGGLTGLARAALT